MRSFTSLKGRSLMDYRELWVFERKWQKWDTSLWTKCLGVQKIQLSTQLNQSNFFLRTTSLMWNMVPWHREQVLHWRLRTRIPFLDQPKYKPTTSLHAKVEQFSRLWITYLKDSSSSSRSLSALLKCAIQLRCGLHLMFWLST